MGWVNYIDRMIMVFAAITREGEDTFTLDALVKQMRDQPLPAISPQAHRRVFVLISREIKKKYISVAEHPKTYIVTVLGKQRYQLLDQSLRTRLSLHREEGVESIEHVSSVSQTADSCLPSAQAVSSNTGSRSDDREVQAVPAGISTNFPSVAQSHVAPHSEALNVDYALEVHSQQQLALPRREMAVKLRQHAMDLMRDLKRRDEYIIALQRLGELTQTRGVGTSVTQDVISRLQGGEEIRTIQSELDGCNATLVSLYTIVNHSDSNTVLENRLHNSRDVVRGQQRAFSDASQLLDRWEAFCQFLPPDLSSQHVLYQSASLL